MDRLPSTVSAVLDRDDALTPDNESWLVQDDAPVIAIDTHAHVFVRGLPLAPQRRHAPDYDATLDAYATHLRANGLSHAVLVQPSFLGSDNAFLLDVMRRFPRRFRGVAVIDPSIADADLRHMSESGVVGMRLNLIGLPVPDLRAPRWRELLARVNALGWHVEVHRNAADLPEIVAPLLEADCTVVVDHFGRPDPLLGARDAGFDYLLSTASSGQVWVKLSAAYRSVTGSNGLPLGQELTGRLLDAFGPHRLVWGSDWPHTQHETLIDYDTSREALNLWVPDPCERKIILCAAAQALFRFR